jgi:6,7-dimethyl-8-ribityllumazine synthase
MPHVLQGERSAPQGRFAIVASRYNESVTTRILDGAVATLREHGVPDDRIDVAWVPGAFEIPLVADRMASSAEYAAVLCIGAVIRGETSHDQHINRAVSLAISDIGLQWGIPVLFGVLTCDTLEQAIHRSGSGAGNKGVECALAALEMVNLLAQLPK